MDSNCNYGASKILFILRNKYHERVSEAYVRKLMRELGLKGATPRQIKRELRKIAKTYEEKRNILKQNFKASRPNQKWVMDCKQLDGAKGCRMTICGIEDLFARRLVAYHIGVTENTNLVAKTFRKALKVRNITDSIILHTDNGSANSSIRFNKLLRGNGFIHSYSGRKDPFDDAAGESFFSLFNANLLVDAAKKHPFKSERDVRERIAAFVDDYNNKRPHGYNGGLTPKQKEAEYERRHKIKVEVGSQKNGNFCRKVPQTAFLENSNNNRYEIEK